MNHKPALRIHSLTYKALIRLNALDSYKVLEINTLNGRLIQVDDREPRNEVVEELAAVMVPRIEF